MSPKLLPEFCASGRIGIPTFSNCSDDGMLAFTPLEPHDGYYAERSADYQRFWLRLRNHPYCAPPLPATKVRARRIWTKAYNENDSHLTDGFPFRPLRSVSMRIIFDEYDPNSGSAGIVAPKRSEGGPSVNSATSCSIP